MTPDIESSISFINSLIISSVTSSEIFKFLYFFLSSDKYFLSSDGFFLSSDNNLFLGMIFY